MSRMCLDSGQSPDAKWRARLLSRSDMMTIARHFNAGLNPQESQVPQGRPNNCHIAHDDHVNGNEFQPSRWDSCRRAQWWPCASTVETPGYCRVVPLGRWKWSSGRESAHYFAGSSLRRLTPAATGICGRVVLLRRRDIWAAEHRSPTTNWLGAGDSRKAGR